MKSKTTVRPRGKIDPERWHRLKDILFDALEETSPAARTALVEARCANDAVLLAEAESLVNEAEALQADATDSLEDCAEHATVTLWQDEGVPSGWRIGAYVVTRELGRGGMGSVYLAARADGQFEKEVAIKVLKRGTDTDEVLHRFSSERHILARLDHPNIARLLDAGTTDDGLPYFVMEYVAGAPVTRFAREHELSVEERLAVFLKICAAVEVAHHNHVIHRDLKPSNILVNADGEPKLLDFGIAKLLTPGQNTAEITAANEQRLTPVCASPEQTDGRPITEASDVYALGALLYEMLSGQKPHKFSSTHPSHDEIARVVREQEPLPPSANADAATARSLRGDLDAIVLKALRKDPAMRYPSVAELAADVRRHLSQQPILARGPGVKYLAGSWLSRKRNRTLVAAVGVMIVLSALLFVLVPRFQQRSAPSGVLPNETLSASDLEKSIAVLPFDNFGNDNPSYFADGVQDNILTDLGKVGDLKVVSRNAVAAYRGKARNAKEIGHELGVGNVLVGSVQKSGDRVRINAQLIDTRTDTQIWAEHYDRKVEDIFALQSELAQTIVTQLKATLSKGEQAEIWKQPTQDLQAYELYSRARSALTSSRGPDPRPTWPEAVSFLEAAIARDPKFTRAYCLLTEVHLLIYRFGDDHTSQRLTAAKESAETALRLEPNLEEARLAQASYYYNGLNNYRRTEQELSIIPSSSPHQAEFYTLASLVERRLGKWKETIRDGQKAVDLDPQNAQLAVNLCQTYCGLRRFADANRVADTAIARAHDEVPTRIWLVKNEAALSVGDVEGARTALNSAVRESMDLEAGKLWLCLVTRDYPAAKAMVEKMSEGTKEMASVWLIMGAVATAEGDVEGARRAHEEAKRRAEASLVKRPDDPDLLGDLASAESALGLHDEALQHVRRAMEMMPTIVDALVGPRSEMRLAEVLGMKGDRDGAMTKWLELVKKPFGLNYGDLKLNPMWDSLRDHPRFNQLLEEAALPIPIDG